MMTPILALVAFLPHGGWTPLFDGKTLQGWHQVGGRATYAVESNAIVGRTVAGSPNSFLRTDKIYGDFELELEVWVDPNLNSGIQIRSNSVGGYQSGKVHGYQIEVDPSKRAWSGGLYDESRRGWLQDVSKNEAGQKAFRNGEWNRYRIVAKGDHFQTWVNGVPVADYRDAMTQTGFIALQVHSHNQSGVEVKWRNLKIWDLGIPTAEPPKGARWLLRTAADTKNWVSESKPDAPCPWNWIDDSLEANPGSGNLLSKDKFSSFRMHLEFMVDDNGKAGQANGNSGVYVMQSYELQILNSAPRPPEINECGAIYTIKSPDYAMALPAGQWQSYDIHFTAPKWNGAQKTADARATIYHNGTMIHNDIVIPKPTGAGMPESPDPRPFRLQDHGNKIRFRNIWIMEKVSIRRPR